MVSLKETIDLIKKSLFEKRRLSDIEMNLLINLLLKHYNVSDYVKNIEIDYNDKYNGIAGFCNENGTMYFNMNIINEIIFKQYYHPHGENKLTFIEYFVLEQLNIVLHEIRHVMQLNVEFSEKDVLEEILDDSRIEKYSRDIYDLNHSLFPIEKDAKEFALNQTIEIINNCSYFDKEFIKDMYNNFFEMLMEGYSFNNPCEGTLKVFYEKVVSDTSKYLSLLPAFDELSTYDKLSFNMPLNKEDLKILAVYGDLIKNNFDPIKTLKKK